MTNSRHIAPPCWPFLASLGLVKCLSRPPDVTDQNSQLLDENANIVRELCGETSLAGIEYLRDQYLSREENTIASDFAARMQNLKAPPL